MRKVILSIISTFIIFITFSSVTYAWISLPKVNTIDDIVFSTQTPDRSLELSLDGINYYTQLDAESLNELINQVILKDITSSDGKEFLGNHYSTNEKVVENVDYISFDLYFRTNSGNASVYLANNETREKISYDDVSSENTYIISKGVDFRSGHDYWYGPDDEMRYKGEVFKYYASDAIRIAVLEDKEDGIEKIFDLSEDEERSFGKSYGALDYFKQMMGIKDLNIPSAPNTIYGLTQFGSNNMPVDEDDNKGLIAILDQGINNQGIEDGYNYGKVKIRIWIEGWDADAMDAILSDKIKIQLTFKTTD